MCIRDRVVPAGPDLDGVTRTRAPIVESHHDGVAGKIDGGELVVSMVLDRRDDAKQPGGGDEGVDGSAVDVVWGPNLSEAAVVDDGDAVGERHGIFLIVRRIDRRDPVSLLEQGYGVTTIYATNDQEDAMALADRIAVINDGRLRQVGTPDDIYRRPVDTFVAGFLGSPPMSFLEGDVSGLEVRIGAGTLPVPPQTPQGRVKVGIRTHDWDIVPAAGLLGVVTSVENH